MNVKLINDFHNSQVTVRTEVTEYEQDCEISLSIHQADRVRKALCGMSNCCCGDVRGRQENNGKRLGINWPYRYV